MGRRNAELRSEGRYFDACWAAIEESCRSCLAFDKKARKKTSEDQMASILNEALEWLDRAEQARGVAGQLADPAARKAVLELAESFDRLARG